MKWKIPFKPPMQWETKVCCDIIFKISGRVADESENYFNMFFKHRKKNICLVLHRDAFFT